jgi:uncharacterized protein (UPF0147 family)
MSAPRIEDLPEELKKIFENPQPKLLAGVAAGLAPLPPRFLVEAWVFLMQGADTSLAAAADNSLSKFPEASLASVVKSEMSPWALDFLAQRFGAKESILELILLNDITPDSAVVRIASICSEKMSQIIVNNQERIIQAPEIIPALESNPHNLKSNTDRLRHFLRLAGILVPGDTAPAEEDQVDEKILEAVAAKLGEAEGDAANPDEAVDALLKTGSVLNEEQRLNLRKYISQLNIGGKIKLAMKGNKEARQILVRDVNGIVACAVIKSPRITDNEVALYASLRNVCDDVIRMIASTVGFTKHYHVKLALCLHPKTPLQSTTGFIKFLTLRDLQKVAKDRNVPNPLRKAAKQLLDLKRK